MNPDEMISQLGGYGLRGGLVYVGCIGKGYITVNTTNDSMNFKVNGARGYKTYITVKLMPSDTYEVSISRIKGADVQYFRDETVRDVYCDDVQSVFEGVYDNHMKVNAGGFIPID